MSADFAVQSGSGVSKRMKSEGKSDNENGPSKKIKLESETFPDRINDEGNIESENANPIKKIKLESEISSEGPSSSKRMKSESDGAVQKQKNAEEHYDAAGLKLIQHGVVYQLKLLTLFLVRGLKKGYSFTLATEMVSAEKFDDVVFGYTTKRGDKNIKKCRFIQVKHKQNEDEKITVSALLNEKEDDFSLKKYFLSYLKIKNSAYFKIYELEDFVISTNIDIDEELKRSLEKNPDKDDILDFDKNGFGRYKIKLDRFRKKNILTSILLRTSELDRLANVLASHTYRKKCLDLSDDLLKTYHAVLGAKVIERNPDKNGFGKFRREFICGDEQSPELQAFREAFRVEYLSISKNKWDEDTFWQKMQDKELTMSSTFGIKFDLIKDPVLEKPIKLAEEIAGMISKGANKKFVEIVKARGRNAIKEGAVNCDIDKLGGYVFVKKSDQNNDEYCFSSRFLDKDRKLLANLDVFRNELIEKLKPINVEFPELTEYTFHIPKYYREKTCEERQLYSKDSMPNDHIDEADINDFLDKLVFSVNQPNEIQIGKIIGKDLDEHFKLIDSELLADKLQKDMLDWMKDKKGRFLTNEKGNEFFEQISQKMSTLVLIGPTLLCLAKMEQFQLSFQIELISEKLRHFLDSKSKQIFNLINSHQTIFGSMKVFQILKNIYQKDDSYIFTSLQNVLFIEDHVEKAFTSETCDLLVIECKAEKKMKSQDQLYAKLAKILNAYKNKKVVLITLENDTFAQKFKNDFSRNKRYKEMKDLKNNLTDLTGRSQNNILMQTKVVFQGNEVNLGSVLDKKSTHMLSGDVLSMIINNETIQISKSLMDSKYEDVKDYFVDRTFGRCLVITSKRAILKEENVLVIDDKKKNDIDKLNEHSSKDILVVSGTGDNFKKLCEKFDDCNIHWLKKKGNQWIWQKSRGDLTKLRKLVDIREQCITKYKPNAISKITDVPDKVFLLAAEPGMGKSVILSRLALKTQSASPSVWIVRCNLLECSSKFKKRLDNRTEINELEAMKFLCEIAEFQHFKYSEEDERTKETILRALTEENIEIDPAKNKGLSLLEIKLFVQFFHHGKVILLFDGFDEISPNYNDLVVKLLKVFKDTKIKKIWLTTRPYNIQSEPEDNLSTFSYALMPFEKEEQHDFLVKFWRKNLKLEPLEKMNESRADIFINELISRLSVSINDQDRKFLSIPLQIYMIATVFSEEFEKFYHSDSRELSAKNKRTLDKKLDLVTLYENFVKTVFDIEQSKDRSGYDRDKDKPSAIRKIEKELAEFKENNKKLAVYSMLEENQVEKILSRKEVEEVRELMSNISDAGEKTGMISKIINTPMKLKEAGDLSGCMSSTGRNTVMITEIVNNKPVFIHRTFAEYFAANYFWEKFKYIRYEKFEKDFIQDIIEEILIKNDFIQVCKFLQLIAKNSFRSKINFLDATKKTEMLLVKLAEQIDDYGSENGTFQSTKVLLGIIEFSLLEQNEKNDLKIRNHFEISTYEALESLLLRLLCVCAEMGYIRLAKALKKYVDKRFAIEYPECRKLLSYSSFLPEHLENDAWNYSPLWIASENGHLNMVEFLIRDLSYDIMWKDKHGADLIQRIFSISAFSVLKSCVELNITSGELFKNIGDSGQKKLPIYEALKANAPSEVVKLLMEKTDVDLINNFVDCDLREISVKEHMSLLLLQYDKEIIQLAIEKGVDLSSSVDVLLRKFTLESLRNPTYDLIYGHGNFSTPFFNSDAEFYNVFPIIELLLKADVGYNNRGDAVRLTTSFQCAERAYQIHQILNEVHKFHTRKDDSRKLILKFIVDSILQMKGFKPFKTIIKAEKICILISCDNEDCNSKMGKLIKNFVEKSPYFKGFRHTYEGNLISILLNSRTGDYNDRTYPTFKRDMTEMFVEYYNGSGTWPDRLAYNAIGKVESYVENMEKIFKIFKKHHRRNVTDIFYSDGSSQWTYEDELRQLKNYDEKKHQYESLDKLSKGVLSGVLYLYLRQDYEKIDDAVKEISEEVLKLEEVMKKLLETKNVQSCEVGTILYDADKILYSLCTLDNVRASDRIQKKLTSKINNIGGIEQQIDAFDLLIEVCLLLNEISRKKVKKTLQSMCRFSDQSSRILDLLKKMTMKK
ncbi:uncharacterized protein LOC135836988 [Planococcus citri]|uniref:uncharacterized protein LOC135836988 n=1 Tax=Planococcus citri TaxID=170843 RepID=UPI0031F96668